MYQLSLALRREVLAMLSKPFAISEVKDPSQIRVVLYSGDRFVHAPLNGMIDVVKEALQSELEDKIQGLEERIKF
ncbi:Uncharacterised protein [Candidatus Bartonella washoeensis]|nr:Uncharacterised protein [Bartonella washoeensis]